MKSLGSQAFQIPNSQLGVSEGLCPPGPPIGCCPRPAGNLDDPKNPRQYRTLLQQKIMDPRLIYRIFLPSPHNMYLRT